MKQFELPIGEDYTDIVPLDEGGMGVIFRARKVNLGVDVVIKRVRQGLEHRLNQRSEADILKTLKHRYLPRIYDIIDGHDGYLYTVMDFIPGCDLEKYVKKKGAVDQKTALKWTRQLCEAVEYLHSQTPPIIHCDIKPKNIMITEQGDICLIDFNTSLIYQSAEMRAIGTSEGYAAPEQYNVDIGKLEKSLQQVSDSDETVLVDDATQTIQRETVPRLVTLATRAKSYGTVTLRTDVYGIGATAYFMLTGYRPALSLDEVIPLERYDIRLGDAFASILERAMQQQPKKRFQSAASMLEALQDLKKSDAQYKKYRRTYQLTETFLALAAVFCLALTWIGWRQMQAGQDSAYMQLVEEGERLGEALNYEESYLVLSEAIMQEPERLEAYSALAALLYRQGQYQECIDLMQEAENIEIGNDERAEQLFANISYITASSHFYLGEYAEALRNYQTAAALCPDVTDYVRDLAVCYAKTGDMQQAKQTLDTLNSMQPNQADVLLASAEIADLSGDTQGALSMLKQVVSLTEDENLLLRSYMMLADVCEKLGADYLEEEITQLQTACSRLDGSRNAVLAERLADAWMGLAQAYPERQEEGWQQALSCYQSLMDSGYQTIAVRQNFAMAQQYLGQYEQAEQTLADLIADYPNDYRGYLRLAFLQADMQDEKPVEQRDYTEFWNYYDQTVEAYAAAEAAGTADTEVLRLKELAEQIVQAGYTR